MCRSIIAGLRPFQQCFSHSMADMNNDKYIQVMISSIDVTNLSLCKVTKGAKFRNRYNQVSHLTQDTNGKVTNSQMDTTNES